MILVGPGVFDIHSPRVPPQEELQTKIKSILNVLPPATSDWMYVFSPSLF